MQQILIGIVAALALAGLVWFVFAGGPSEHLEDESQTSEMDISGDSVAVEPFVEPEQSERTTSDTTTSTQISTSATPTNETLMHNGREITIGAVERGLYFNKFELNSLGFGSRPEVRYWSDLNFEFLIRGGPPPDGISSIDAPRYVSTDAADAWITDQELVIGFEYNGIARAYPVSIMNWHEIVNDDFDGTKIIITFCPLCNSGLAFLAPHLNGKFSEFGTTGRIYQSDLVMYDRITGTFWSQLDAEPMIGPLVGEFDELTRLPLDMIPYGLWKQEHPDTVVLDRPVVGDRLGNSTDHPQQAPGGFVRLYDRDSYASYRLRNPKLGEQTSFGIPITDDRLLAKTTIVGIVVDGQAKAYDIDAIHNQQLHNDEVNGVPLVVLVLPGGQVRFFERTLPNGDELLFSLDEQGMVDQFGHHWSFSGSNASGNQLEEIVGTVAFWFAWVMFNTETELFTFEP